jgi:hypothetical protein
MSIGNDGQVVVITKSDSGCVTFQDGAVLTNSKFRLGGSNVQLCQYDSMTMIQNGATGDWVRADKAGASSSSLPVTSDIFKGDGAGGASAFGSKTANYVLAAPNGSAGAMVARAMVTADLPDYVSRTWYGYNSQAGTVPASGADQYYYAHGSAAPSTSNARNTRVGSDGVARKLYWNMVTTATQPSSGSIQCWVTKNGVDTTMTVTWAANEAGSEKTDLVNTVTFAAGDGIGLHCKNNATANGLATNNVSVEYAYTK